MKIGLKINAMLLAAILIIAAGCDQPTNIQQQEVNEPETEQTVNGQEIPGQFIVVFNGVKSKGLTMAQRAVQAGETIQRITDDYGINRQALRSEYRYAISGFTAQLSDEQLNNLKNDDRVDYIEQDRIVTLAPPCGTPNGGPCDGDGGGGGDSGGQTTPYGITRVGGGISSSGTAWVIDTGIDLDHPDLNVDVSRSATFITKGKDSKSADDGNGHGSHVAGTIGAIDNGSDVIGVAAGATLVAVKVLDRRGSGSYSVVINGVDYVAANGSSGDVVNMSLGGPTSQALDDAVKNAASTGIKFALAAGNSGEDAANHSPARVNGANIYTVSAIDESDVFASFSNFGNPPVDYAAPGVGVLSTWKDGGTNTISGTSMSSPHVAGLLLLGNITSDGTAINDPDGDPDPIAHN
jgi:hypothetical protein